MKIGDPRIGVWGNYRPVSHRVSYKIKYQSTLPSASSVELCIGLCGCGATSPQSSSCLLTSSRQMCGLRTLFSCLFQNLSQGNPLKLFVLVQMCFCRLLFSFWARFHGFLIIFSSGRQLSSKSVGSMVGVTRGRHLDWVVESGMVGFISIVTYFSDEISMNKPEKGDARRKRRDGVW